jgi:hypothetical protein
MVKLLKNKASGSKLPAINLAQFPLGSALSRAAARFMADARAMSQDDCDALTLYRGCRWLRASMVPGSSDLEASAAYARGRELAGQVEKPFDFAGASSAASRKFAVLFGRLPERGDILRFSQLQVLPAFEQYLHEEFIAAWTRQLPDLPCPLRFSDGRLLKRERISAKTSDPLRWHAYEDICLPERDWRAIQEEAGADSPNRISGVVFLDGVHCRPATERELREDHTAPSGGVLGILTNVESRVIDEGGLQS